MIVEIAFFCNKWSTSQLEFVKMKIFRIFDPYVNRR